MGGVGSLGEFRQRESVEELDPRPVKFCGIVLAAGQEFGEVSLATLEDDRGIDGFRGFRGAVKVGRLGGIVSEQICNQDAENCGQFA